MLNTGAAGGKSVQGKGSLLSPHRKVSPEGVARNAEAEAHQPGQGCRRQRRGPAAPVKTL